MRRIGAGSASFVVLSLFVTSAAVIDRGGQSGGTRDVGTLAQTLSAPDPIERVHAACELKLKGGQASPAVAALVALLADATVVDPPTCVQQSRWWRRTSERETTPGDEAAAALASIGSTAYAPLVAALNSPHWVARKNAAWALGALHDSRAVDPLLAALRDPHEVVREQAAWALGVLGDHRASAPLVSVLKHDQVKVRRQAALALGTLAR